MKHLLGGIAVAGVLAGLIWAAPAMAATSKAGGFHMPSTNLTDVSAQRRYRVYRRYPRYRYYRPYYRPYAAPYYYGRSYYPYPYYRPGFYIGTPFFGFGF